MKKIILVVIMAMMSVLVGCEKKQSEPIDVMVPSGIPLLAIGGVLDAATIHVVQGPDLLAAAMTSKTMDIVIAPITVGARLFQLGGSKYQLHSVISNGNSYIITRNTEELTITSLSGKTIHGYAEHATPGLVLKESLLVNNVEAELVFSASVSDFVAPFISGSIEYLMVAEPTLSFIEKEIGSIAILDLQAVLRDASIIDVIPQAGIFINPDSKKKNEVAKWLDALEASMNQLQTNTQAYVDEILDKHAFFTGLGKDVLLASIPRSQIEFHFAQSATESLLQFYQFLYARNQNIIGTDNMSEEFYWKRD